MCMYIHLYLTVCTSVQLVCRSQFGILLWYLYSHPLFIVVIRQLVVGWWGGLEREREREKAKLIIETGWG